MKEEHIHSITFSESDAIEIIRALDVNKVRDQDNISVRMIKLCANSVVHPLTLMFQNSLATGTIANQRKRANTVPIHKKNGKKIVSLLPICSKNFERLIFNELLKFFVDKNLLSKNQSGFCSGDSCDYQLLSVTHDIF